MKTEMCTCGLEKVKVRYVSIDFAAGRQKTRGANTREVIENQQGIVSDTWAECLSLIVSTHCGLVWRSRGLAFGARAVSFINGQ